MNACEITIRAATVVDVDAVTEMWHELARQHNSYNPKRWNWRDDAADQFAKYFCESLGSDRTIALVAVDSPEAGGNIAGFLVGSTGRAASVLAAETRGEISDVFVRPENRHCGTATKLIEKAMEIMTQRGAEHVSLSVAKGNSVAMKMYEKLGFETCVVQYYKKLT